jgi:hypothetical protein
MEGWCTHPDNTLECVMAVQRQWWGSGGEPVEMVVWTDTGWVADAIDDNVFKFLPFDM